MRKFFLYLQDIIETLRVMIHPQLAGLLYLKYRLEWRGVLFGRMTDEKIFYANKYFLRKTGWSLKEFRSKKFIEFVHPDDIDLTLEAISKVNDGKPLTDFINRYRIKSGGYICVHWNSVQFGRWSIAEAVFSDCNDVNF